MKGKIGYCLLLIVGTIIFLTWGGNPRAAISSTSSKPSPQEAIPLATSSSDWQQRWDKIVTDAKKEGRVLVYMAPAVETRMALTEAFKKKYGLTAEFILGRGAALAEKIFTERRAGIYQGDIMIQGNIVQLIILKPKGVLEELDPFLILPEVIDSKAWLGGKVPYLDKDRTVLSFLAKRALYVERNTNLVKAEEVRSLNDLLNPNWKGQVIMFDPTIEGSGSGWFILVLHTLGREKGIEYMRQFIKQGPIISRDDRLMIEGLAKGKHKLAIGISGGPMADFKQKGAPVEYIKMKEDIYLAPGLGDISMLKNAAHPNASILFLNWLLTKEAQTIFSKTYGAPSSRVDVPTDGIDPLAVSQPGEKFYMETEDDVLSLNELMKISKEIFAPLMK